MAAEQDPSPPANDDPSTASDALSLHTIADQDDAYATQEQEDADFALALQLEEEETQRLVQSRGQTQGRAEGRPATQSEEQAGPPVSYRDDPEAEGDGDDIANLPPYRDDPDAAPTDEEAQSEAPAAGGRAKRVRSCLRVLGQMIKTYFCVLGICTLVTILIIVVLILVLVVFGKREDYKEAAWRASGSADNDLKLPKLYPALEEGASDNCKKGWEKYARSLSCHRMILSSAWDNGDADAVVATKADPYGYSDEVCTDMCHRSIKSFDTPMRNVCSRRADRFDLTHYGENNKGYFDKDEIDEGPLLVQKTLIQRWERLCARPPRQQRQSEWGTCAADLWMRWGIVDGKNEENLNGLDSFLEKTNEKRTIPGGWKKGEVDKVDGHKSYNVYVPRRNFGPGVGETDCGYCTIDWLERKLWNFEYGQMLNKTNGEILGLSEFHDKMKSAAMRCGPAGEHAVYKARNKWSKYGWWCDNEPCKKDIRTDREVKQILHGMSEEEFPLTAIRTEMAKSKGALKDALGALHDSMASMPCSIWFQQDIAMNAVVPHQHIIDHLCSDQCRNAVDRIQEKNGKTFEAAARADPRANIFKAWETTRESHTKLCKSNRPELIVSRTTAFCAPGYAAIGQPTWIFPENIPSKPEILAAFAPAIDKLAAELNKSPPRVGKDEESQTIAARKIAESVCNPCIGEIFIGKNPGYKKTIAEWQDDPRIDGRNYTEIAKKGWVTCAKQAGIELGWWQKKRLWEQLGLDRYDRN